MCPILLVHLLKFLKLEDDMYSIVQKIKTKSNIKKKEALLILDDSKTLSLS